MARKARKRETNERWSWKKCGVVLSTLVSAFTLLQQSGQMLGKLYDKLGPNSDPVTYAQLETLRSKPFAPVKLSIPEKNRKSANFPDRP
jgi:hypothetical protein